MNETAQDVQAPEISYSLRHLQAELARIHLIFQHWLRQMPHSGKESGLGGLVITDDEIASLFQDRKAEGTAVTPDLMAAYRTAEDEVARILEAAQAQGILPRLAALCRSFRLHAFERDVLLICLAPATDLRYERLFGYIQDDVTLRRPTVSTVLRLLTDMEEERLLALPYFFRESPLFRHRLLHALEDAQGTPVLGQQLVVEKSVLAWLLGRYEPDVQLKPYISLTDPVIGDEERLLTAEIWSTITTAIDGQTVALFHGEDEGIQAATARLLAASNGLPLLHLDLGAAVKGGVAPIDALRLALRDARLVGSLLYIRGWDVCLESGAPARPLVELLFDAAYPIVVASAAEWYAEGVERTQAVLRIHFSKPGYRQRLALWEFYLERIDYPVAEDLSLPPLASQFALTSRQIQDAVASARDAALQQGAAIALRDLITAARAHSSPNLSGLARKIEPRYDWPDLVLPQDQKTMLHELVQTVKGRGIVMEEWGVGRKLKTSAGVTVLFAGPPGTGKTMAAEVISAELGLDLYKLDLSMVVSKYIGETEKNLGRIFDEAQSSSAVLFFDEADAIFGKRSEVRDAHDRYANMEVSYLLQRMELYDGVTILATNLRSNMDEAFTRRMQFIVDFPFPDEKERLSIWRTLFPVELPQADDIDLDLLATRFKLAGGNIRNIIAGAAFLAAADGGQVTMEHLLHSTRRELQKMGRLISDVDLTY